MAETETKVSIPISRIYWDALQASLNAEVRRLAKEISSVLHQPEEPLMRAIKKNTLDVYIFEESNSSEIEIESMRCSHLVPSTDNPEVLCRCNQPILIGAGKACPAHLSKESPEFDSVERLRIIKSFGESYWIDQNNIIRNKGDLKPIGRYKVESKQCLLFKIE
jgi:hypothetical protein